MKEIYSNSESGNLFCWNQALLQDEEGNYWLRLKGWCAQPFGEPREEESLDGPLPREALEYLTQELPRLHRGNAGGYWNAEEEAMASSDSLRLREELGLDA